MYEIQKHEKRLKDAAHAAHTIQLAREKAQEAREKAHAAREAQEAQAQAQEAQAEKAQAAFAHAHAHALRQAEARRADAQQQEAKVIKAHEQLVQLAHAARKTERPVESVFKTASTGDPLSKTLPPLSPLPPSPPLSPSPVPAAKVEEAPNIDLFLFLQNNKSIFNGKKIYVVVPGNAGQPGGGHGFKLYNSYYLFQEELQKIFEIKKKKLLNEIYEIMKAIDLSDVYLSKEQLKTITYDYKNLESKSDDYKNLESKLMKKLNNIPTNLSTQINKEQIVQIVQMIIYLIININLQQIEKFKTPLEEQIIRRLDSNTFNYHMIATSWGLYKSYEKETTDKVIEYVEKEDINGEIINGKIITSTLQKVDYTNENVKVNYKICFEVKNVLMDISERINVDGFEKIKENDLIPVNLLFTFAPNHSNGYNIKAKNTYPSLAATFDNHNIHEYNKEALKNCIRACVEKIDKSPLIPKIICIPHIGSGINACYISEPKDNQSEFKKLVLTVIEEYEIHNLETYIIFNKKSQTPVKP